LAIRPDLRRSFETNKGEAITLGAERAMMRIDSASDDPD
jgi:hypothetical protein